MAERCWRQIVCNRSQANLDKLLVCGQSFRWKKNGVGEWLGVMANLVWRLRQTEQCIEYQVYGGNEKKMELSVDIAAVNSKSSSKHAQNLSETFINSDAVEEFPSREIAKSPRSSLALTGVDDPVGATELTGLSNLNLRTRKRIINGSKYETLIVKSESVDCIKKLKAEPEKSRQKRANKIKKDVKETNPISELWNGKKIVSRGNPDIDEGFKSLVDTKIEPLYDGVDDGQLDDTDSGDNKQHAVLLRDYFQLDVDLVKLYCDWSAKDPHFSEVAGSLEGIRILRQDPTENLLSFVCSSNNNISRISGMVDNLCRHYGEFIAVVDGEDFFSVPSFRSLSGEQVETHLRQLGFGYRAKFISSIARHLVEQNADGWLESLRHLSYEEAKKELLTLMGVGPKVADCVCLMSLDKPGAVPVDTHVWQITLKHYMAQLKTAKSLTDKIYNEIGDFYRELWGPYAGWAHSVLFTADLKQNKSKSDSQKGTSGKTSKAKKQKAKTS